ncbi:hypothetical protein PsW64_03976 [Pseudovibrio sp. W64]|nr:hypothetical protein PsW64_03976 [Pseudovibrio sp. W64]KZL26465.1 hypothetical protein PsAD37_01904 [Pseudovibrio sp. Ad37]
MYAGDTLSFDAGEANTRGSVMWVGNGEFDSYGYLETAFIKGQMDGELKPDMCYRIFDRGGTSTSQQFHFVPVDMNGNELGPSVLNTAGNIVYSIWEKGHLSQDCNISNLFMA